MEKSLTEIKPFSAGSDVTVFEFIDKFNAYCLGTKKAKLYHNYLSISIQAQTESFNHNFDEMINFLRSTYGKIEVVSANLLAELERRKKPGDNELPERADSLLAIMNVILRIQNLRTHLPEEQVMAEISSYSFLHRIQNLLCTADYLKLSRDLVQNGLDARVALGPNALRVTLNRLKTTIAVLEPVVEKMKGKVKSKSVHVVDLGNKDDGEAGHLDHVYSIDSRLTTSGKWWNRNFQFPCPIPGHEHAFSRTP